MKYLICYDICSYKRLGKVAKLLEEHGIRTQKSVFFLDCKKEIAEDLLYMIKTIINEETDKVSCYRICDKCFSKMIRIGVKAQPLISSFVIL